MTFWFGIKAWFAIQTLADLFQRRALSTFQRGQPRYASSATPDTKQDKRPLSRLTSFGLSEAAFSSRNQYPP